MNKEIILKIGNKLKEDIYYYGFQGRVAELKNLINSYCGKNNSFYEAVDNLKMTATNSTEQLNSIISAFTRAVENDLISNVSYERKLKIEVVNDYLTQANELLNSEDFHPAVSAFLIGASLEEFLRNWVNEQNLDLANQKPTIDSYAILLMKNNLITKQELKDISSWAGNRNNAAHGHWKLVDNQEKILLMLAGVNLFIKKYST